MTLLDTAAPAVPIGVRELSREQVRRSLLDGSFGAALVNDATGHERGDVRAVRLAAEKHRRDSSALILDITTAPTAAGAPRRQELVLFYVRQADAAEAVQVWWFPADPWLPALQAFVASPASVLDATWERRWPQDYDSPGLIALDRLSYYPGHRASFLLSAPGWPGRLVMKLVRPATFDACLYTAHQLERVGLRERVLLPRLLASSASLSALVFEHLPGVSLRGLDRTARQHLVSQAAAVLANIHETRPPAVPLWDPLSELSRTRLLVGSVRRSWPEIASTFEERLARLERRLEPAHTSYQRLVHNDFSTKNLLWQADGAAGGRLAVLDWDRAVLGPVERDISSLLGGLRIDGGSSPAWLSAYERRTGQVVDLDLVQTLLAHQRLLKLGRLVLEAGGPTDAASEALRRVTESSAC